VEFDAVALHDPSLEIVAETEYHPKGSKRNADVACEMLKDSAMVETQAQVVQDQKRRVEALAPPLQDQQDHLPYG